MDDPANRTRKTSSGTLASNSSLLLIGAIGVAALVLSVAVYQSMSSTSTQIIHLAQQDIESETRAKSSDVAAGIAARMEDVEHNLQVLANSPDAQDSDPERMPRLLAATQGTTRPLTFFYAWYDGDGTLLWTSIFDDDPSYLQFQGVELGHRQYFIKAKETRQPFYDDYVEAVDGTLRMHISYPIIDQQTGEFVGIVAAGINFDALQQDLASTYLSSDAEFGGRLSVLDRNGVYLMTRTPEFIGKSYSDGYVQNALGQRYSPQDLERLNEFFADSIASPADRTIQIRSAEEGRDYTLASSPVVLAGRHFMTVVAMGPHSFSQDVAALVDGQRTMSTILIGSIGAISVGIASVILAWNKRLRRAVQLGTAQLNEANRELSRMYEEAKQHDRMQTEFTNIAAHELRTPIQPILGIVDLLKADLDGRDRVEVTGDAIAVLDRNARRLQRLSAEILDATRIEAGTLKLERVPLDMNEKVKAVIEDVGGFASGGKGLEIEFRPATDARTGGTMSLPVMADRLRMFEVLSNLIRNAVQFSSGRTGKITITTGRGKDGGSGTPVAVVSVRDPGAGISPDVLPKLFTKFSVDREKGGTGLGLFIAKSIVEAHGGKIWAENNPDGAGATFTFTLPLALPAAQQQQQ